MMREVTEDLALTMDSGNTYNFRKGDKVGIFPPIVHFDPEIYPDPYTYRYDRFINASSSIMKNAKALPASNCYLPFGGGANYCPGRKFANYEIKAIATILLNNYSIEFVSKEIAIKTEINGSRAGLGIFPPKICDLIIRIFQK
jgi:cholesterol 7alpha-monooxygenase